MKARFLIIATLILQSFNALCQAPPEEFFAGLKLFPTDRAEAKKSFAIAAQKEPNYFGSYNFLGMLCESEHKPDSAIAYYKKCIELNTTNMGHTREFTYTHLINLYTYQRDFANAFAIGWEAYKLYPENREITFNLKDVCLWSFYIKYDKLPADYLSPDLKTEYVVNSIAQEYLIVRKLRVGDNGVSTTSQALQMKNNASYDVLTCATPGGKQTITANFKINWDMSKDFGGKNAPTQSVINDTKAPVYERVGATLVADFSNKVDLKTEIERLGVK